VAGGEKKRKGTQYKNNLTQLTLNRNRSKPPKGPIEKKGITKVKRTFYGEAARKHQFPDLKKITTEEYRSWMQKWAGAGEGKLERQRGEVNGGRVYFNRRGGGPDWGGWWVSGNVINLVSVFTATHAGGHCNRIGPGAEGGGRGGKNQSKFRISPAPPLALLHFETF